MAGHGHLTPRLDGNYRIKDVKSLTLQGSFCEITIYKSWIGKVFTSSGINLELDRKVKVVSKRRPAPDPKIHNKIYIEHSL